MIIIKIFLKVSPPCRLPASVKHENGITFCGNSSLLRWRTMQGEGGVRDQWKRKRFLTEMKKNVFRLTFNVNCSGRSDKFSSYKSSELCVFINSLTDVTGRFFPFFLLFALYHDRSRMKWKLFCILLLFLKWMKMWWMKHSAYILQNCLNWLWRNENIFKWRSFIVLFIQWWRLQSFSIEKFWQFVFKTRLYFLLFRFFHSDWYIFR